MKQAAKYFGSVGNIKIMPKPKDRSKGITILALIFIIASIDQLLGQSNYGNYRFMFQELSDGLIFLRYLGSLLLRSVGIFLGIELLFLREWARKFLIGLSIYHIVTIYWRHPYSVFRNLASWEEHKMLGYLLPAGTEMSSGYPIFPPGAEFQPLAHQWMPLFLMVYFILLDLCFNGFILWFLTRAKVKAQFTN